ncbi:hypothetical protein PISL3812_01645 [Talaromyces islandicus]|uniref:Uncharacterized protein n=1 Tax=Talaromyces islandicus TaxID=28573 RepID=A0A0U1LMN5_TALIS|nr:hypothetical protein PISL3812_01645 [Talaromyces islandicus]
MFMLNRLNMAAFKMSAHKYTHFTLPFYSYHLPPSIFLRYKSKPIYLPTTKIRETMDMENYYILDEMPAETASIHDPEWPAITEDASLEVSAVSSSQKRIMDVESTGEKLLFDEFVDTGTLEKSLTVKNLSAIESNSQKRPSPNKEETADKSFHHENIFGQKIQARSNTPAADSMFYIVSTLGRKPSDKLWDPKARNKNQSLRYQTLLREAQKWVDPVVYMGNQKKLKGLRGNNLRDAIRHQVRKMYLPTGTWVHDEDRHEIVKDFRCSKFRVYKGFAYRNRHRWTEPYTKMLKKPRRKKSLKKEKLTMRETECSPLHWSSTPETEPMAANLEAQPFFQTSRSAVGKGICKCFWWKKLDSPNEAFFEASENNTESTLAINVNQGDSAEDMSIDTMVVTGNALNIVQEAHRDDALIDVDALERKQSDAVRPSYWACIWPGLTGMVERFFGRMAGSQELYAADIYHLTTDLNDESGWETPRYWDI